MPANIPEIIWATAAKREPFRILEFLDINFIKCRVDIIFNPEDCRSEKVVVFNQFTKANGMNFFATTDHFVSSMGVHIFDKVR